MSTQNITSLDGSSYEAIHSSIFSYLKMFSMQRRNIITVEDNKKRMNITNFINIYHIISQHISHSTQNITSLDGSSYKAIDSSISQNIFSYLKMFSMQCRRNITVEEQKKNEYS